MDRKTIPVTFDDRYTQVKNIVSKYLLFNIPFDRLKVLA